MLYGYPLPSFIILLSVTLVGKQLLDSGVKSIVKLGLFMIAGGLTAKDEYEAPLQFILLITPAFI